MSKFIKVNKSEIPSLVSTRASKAFFEGLSNLRGSVDCVQKAGECFASIDDSDWDILKKRIPGEARRWAQNARDVIKKGMHPAFALMAGTLGRKARKLPPKDQERILREPVEVAILSEEGKILDKKMILASELTTSELGRVILEDNSKAWIADPREQALMERNKIKSLAAKEQSVKRVEITRPAYTVNNKGVTLKRKSLSFGQFKELAEDVEKVRKELS